MGKLQSKHAAECFLVNAHLNKALEEQIWKKKSGLDLANYNMDQSLSELSICLEDKCGTVPLRVELPPQLGETDTSKVLKLDQGDGEEEEDDEDEDGCEEKEEKANNLNIEEIECGVQFEGSENSKQEWSFTLYDFDGHGRITKEDLASLLKALYDAVGSSIRLPPNGAKTLKLRLTVGQDRTQIHAISAGKPLGARGKRKENGGSGSKAKTSKESPKAPKPFSKLNNLTRATVKVNNQTQEAAAAAAAQGQAQAEASGLSRKQLSLEDQQQLVELVQENMERNHVKQLRRHHSDCHGPGGEKPGHHKRRHKGRSAAGQTKTAGVGGAMTAVGGISATVTSTATALALAEDRSRGACGESQDRRNYYLDLAGVDSSKLNNATTTTTVTTTPKLQNTDGGYHRSRSHDLKCDNVKRESDRLLLEGSPRGGVGGGGFPLPHPHHQHLLQHNHLRSRSFDPQDNAPRPPKTAATASAPEGAEASKTPADCGNAAGAGGGEGSPHKHSRFRPVSLPGHVPTSVSPHYHRRHRHREKDHDLAMQQVAAWIERQHAWDMDGERVIVQRHHHHHIHEHHHHHHYHHYYEA